MEAKIKFFNGYSDIPKWLTENQNNIQVVSIVNDYPTYMVFYYEINK